MSDFYKLKNITQTLSSDNNLHFIVKRKDLSIFSPRTADLILRKCALYADKTIIVGGSYSSCTERQSHTDWEKNHVTTSTHSTYNDLQAFPENLHDAIRASLGSDTFRKAVFCLPSSASVEEHDDDIDESDDARWSTRDHFRFAEDYGNPYGIPVALQDHFIRAQFVENDLADDPTIDIIRLYLPLLRNVRLNTLLKMREDHGDAFIRFHRTLKKLITEAQELDSDRKLKDLLENVDSNVRDFEDEMQKVERMRSSLKKQAMVTSSAISLSFLLPSVVAEWITRFIGDNKAKDFIKGRFELREDEETLKNRDYYVPWLCNHKDNLKRLY